MDFAGTRTRIVLTGAVLMKKSKETRPKQDHFVRMAPEAEPKDAVADLKDGRRRPSLIATSTGTDSFRWDRPNEPDRKRRMPPRTTRPIIESHPQSGPGLALPDREMSQETRKASQQRVAGGGSLQCPIRNLM